MTRCAGTSAGWRRIAATVLVAVAAQTAIGQQFIYVNDATGNDGWSGLCETYQSGLCGPKKTIAAGMAVAKSGDSVIIAPGTYAGDGNRDLDFAGKAITVRGSDPAAPGVVDATVIDCQGSEWDRHRAFKFVSGEGLDSVLAGLTIINGCAPLEDQWGAWLPVGGAIYCAESSATIKSCVFTNNQACVGGAIRALGYYSSAEDGAELNDHYECVVTDCSFMGNATWTYGCAAGSGGALDGSGGDWTIEGCTFAQNACHCGMLNLVGGGAIQLNANSATLKGCQVRDNYVESAPAAPGDGNGGGVFLAVAGGAQLIGCTISGNSAARDGGGVFCLDSSLTVVGCRFFGNSAGPDGHGGALCAEIDNVPAMLFSLTNCEFSGNQAHRGGAFARLDGSMISLGATQCTVVGNRAEYGAAISWYGGYRLVANSIIWNGPDWLDSTSLGVLYSNVEGGWTGLGNINADPVFVDPGRWDDNGTPGDPSDDVWVNGDYLLQPDSPCIDAADNNRVPEDEWDLDGDGNAEEPVPYDIADGLRMVDDPDTPDTGAGGPSVVDMGAREFQAGILRGDLNCDGLIDFGDINPFVLALSNWPEWKTRHPDCPERNADINGDGQYGGEWGFGDINPFVDCLAN